MVPDARAFTQRHVLLHNCGRVNLYRHSRHLQIISGWNSSTTARVRATLCIAAIPVCACLPGSHQLAIAIDPKAPTLKVSNAQELSWRYASWIDPLCVHAESQEIP